MRSLDGTSLVAGIGLAAFGALLVADRSGAIDLDFAWLGVAAAALVGVILLISGIDR
jgi:hypothetical protein